MAETGKTVFRSIIDRIFNTFFLSERRRAISFNVGWMMFDRIFRLGLGTLIIIWMARYLGPEQFGRYNFALSIIGVMAAVSGLGLHTIIVREVVRTPEKAGAILTASFIAMATVGTAGAVIFNLLPEKVVLAVDVSGGLVAIMSLMLIFKATDFVRSWFESQMQSRVTILAESALFVIAAAIRIYLLLNGAQLLAFVYLLVIEAAVLSALFIYVFVRFSGIRLTSAVSWPLARDILRPGFPLMLAGVSITLYMRTDQIMLGVMIDQTAVGIYAAAVRISELWYFVPTAIAASTLPVIVSHRQNDPNAYDRVIKNLYRLMWALSLSAIFVVNLFGNFFIFTLFGPAYADAGAILIIHIWAGIFVALGVMRGNWMVAEDLQNYGALFTVGGCIVNIIGNWLLIPLLGITGAAWATVFSYATVVFFIPLLFKRTRRMVYVLVWPF